MGIIVKRSFYLLSLILLFGVFSVNTANAASLSSITDTVTTSRPSSSAYLYANQTAGVNWLQVVDTSGTSAQWIASDSATIMTAGYQTGLIVASMSAQQSTSPTSRYLYFTSNITNGHSVGAVVQTPITAKHTVKFNATSGIPANGRIIVTFPTITDLSGSNLASPSATGFEFNNLASGNISVAGATCSGVSLVVDVSTTTPKITCTTSTSVATGATITMTIGSNTPALINPTKLATAGTNDSWKVQIRTQDSNNIDIDTGSAKVATIESVQVQATVEPSLTFTIAGLLNTDNYNTIAGSSSCGSETSNSGIDSTATFVNLGLLTPTGPNKAGQVLTVTTNGAAGYVITATSSGKFINPASGFYLTDNIVNGGNNGLTAIDTPAPWTIPANGTAFFGISPCGADIPTAVWGAGSTTMAAGSAKTANPWNTGTNSYYATIASNTGGPVSGAKTVVRYGAEVTGTTPPGVYTTTMTYVATATF